MDLIVHAHHVTLTNRINEIVQRRLHFALDRHEQYIMKAEVWLSNEGLHSGAHERCRVMVHVRNGPPVVVEETRENLPIAISKAADACERALRRQIERRRSQQRKAA